MYHRHHWRHAFRHNFGPPRSLHRRRHGGGRRLFEQGDLRWAALALIAEKPRHGYDIIKAIEEGFGGAYAPSPGIVYPTLTLLEDMGYASAVQAEGGRKMFTITAEGEAILAAHRGEVDALFAFMAEMRARHAQPAPDIKRAWENLRAALNVRIGGAPLSPDQTQIVARALDVAATTISGV